MRFYFSKVIYDVDDQNNLSKFQKPLYYSIYYKSGRHCTFGNNGYKENYCMIKFGGVCYCSVQSQSAFSFPISNIMFKNIRVIEVVLEDSSLIGSDIVLTLCHFP